MSSTIFRQKRQYGWSVTQLSRRGFLGLAASATAGVLASAALDPERLLWVPGQRKLFLPPQRTLVQARTLQEALSKGLTAVFPDGSKLVISLFGPSQHARAGGSLWPPRATIAEMLADEIRGVEAMGGRVIKIADLHVSMHEPLAGLQPGWNW